MRNKKIILKTRRGREEKRNIQACREKLKHSISISTRELSVESFVLFSLRVARPERERNGMGWSRGDVTFLVSWALIVCLGDALMNHPVK